MQIAVTLMGSLREFAPPGGKLDLPSDAAIRDMLDVLQIAEDWVHVVTVNGKFEYNREHQLQAQDKVTVLPVIIGHSAVADST